MGKGEDQLLEAVKSQDIPAIQKLLHKGKGKLLGSSKKVNVNHQDAEGFSALHQTCVLGNIDIAYILIDVNAMLDIQDKKGMRPLHYCSWKGRVEMVAALLESGSKCNIPSLNGSTPLHLAAQYGHYSVCKMLLQYGADPSVRHGDGNTSLDLACEFGRQEVVDLFLASSISIALLENFRAQTSDNDFSPMYSPLHVAARNGHTNVIRSLLQAGMDINWRTTTGTCLHEAVTNEKPEIVQLLIDCGIDINKRSGLGQTALELAKKIQKSPTVMEIIKKLSDAQPGSLQVYAINDFNNIYDDSSLAFTKGTVITVLERNPNGNWKGRIGSSNGRAMSVGYFPSSYVQAYQQPNHNNSLAGSDDSGIHPHDDEGGHLAPSSNLPPSPHYHPQQWPRSASTNPAKPPQVSHKYVNVDPRSIANHQLISKVTLISPNVNNPSYDDVICSQQTARSNGSTSDRPITVSRSTQEMSVARPHITNPGYEDVLLDCVSTSSPTNTSSSHGSSGSHAYHADYALQQRNVPVSASDSCRSSNSMNSLDSKYSLSSESDEQVYRWLLSVGMEQYTPNFVQHGYDLPTIARTSPSDLTAIRISKPPHRKKLATHVSLLRKESPPSPQIDELPLSVNEWLSMIGLVEYTQIFNSNDINSVEKLVQTSWEDIQEMNIEKLGHQKKLIVALSKLNQTYKRICDKTHPQFHVKQRQFNPNQFQQTPIQLPLNPQQVLQHRHQTPHNLHQAPHNPHQTPHNPHQTPHNPHHAPHNPHQAPHNPHHTPHNPHQTPHNPHQGPQNPTSKPQVQVKPKKNFSSFKENPGLSLELQKALNKRQQIIDDAGSSQENKPQQQTSGSTNNPVLPLAPKPHIEKRERPHLTPIDVSMKKTTEIHHAKLGSPVKTPTTPPTNELAQKLKRNNSNRGPPPNPPKRTTSICIDDSPHDSPDHEAMEGGRVDVKSIAALMGHQRPKKEMIKTPTSPPGSSQNAFHFPSQSHDQPAPPTQKPTRPVNQPNVSTNEITQIHPGRAVAKQPVSSSANVSSVLPKPVLNPKPKPANKPNVMKKPQVNKQASSQSTMPRNDITSATPLVKKAFHGELGKHFDLSVLDRIDQQNKTDNSATTPVDVKPGPPPVPLKPTTNDHKTDKHTASGHTGSRQMDSLAPDEPLKRVDSSEEFEWPAPPPSMLNPVGDAAPYPDLPCFEYSNVTEVKPQVIQCKPDPLNSGYPSPAPKTPTPPSPGEIRTCFEEDQDTGTVKRRPPSITHRDDVEIIEKPISMNYESSGIAKKVTGLNTRWGQSNQPNNAPKPPTRPLTRNPSPPAVTPGVAPSKPKLPPKLSSRGSSSFDDNNLPTMPPPIPLKVIQRGQSAKDVTIETINTDGTEEGDTAKTQQMLDDIGSMFDDLVQEFDDILG